MQFDIKNVTNRSILQFNNTRIFINPSSKDAVKYVQDMNDRKEKRIHIFLTNPMILEEEHFKEFMELLFTDPNDRPVVTIHVHKEMPDFKEALIHCYLPELNTSYVPKIRVFCEHKPIVFEFHNRIDIPISVEWNSDKLGTLYLQVKYILESHVSTGYRLPRSKFGGDGAIRNVLEKMYPDHFKDAIIRQFKKVCPESILKSFKDDDDIWDYVNGRGEWSS